MEDHLSQDQKDRIRNFKRGKAWYGGLTFLLLGLWIYTASCWQFTLFVLTSKLLPVVSSGGIICSGMGFIFLLWFQGNLKARNLFTAAKFFFSLLAGCILFLIINLFFYQSEEFQASKEIYRMFIMFACVICEATVLQEEGNLISYLHHLAMRNIQQELLIEDNKEQTIILKEGEIIEESQAIYGNRCSICNEDTEIKQQVVQLACHHIFHPHCINTWISKKPFCPNCRSPIS